MALRALIEDAHINAPQELAELPQLAAAFALCLLALAVAWAMLP
jgi:hypothetical protein